MTNIRPWGERERDRERSERERGGYCIVCTEMFLITIRIGGGIILILPSWVLILFNYYSIRFENLILYQEFKKKL